MHTQARAHIPSRKLPMHTQRRAHTGRYPYANHPRAHIPSVMIGIARGSPVEEVGEVGEVGVGVREDLGVPVVRD